MKEIVLFIDENEIRAFHMTGGFGKVSFQPFFDSTSENTGGEDTASLIKNLLENEKRNIRLIIPHLELFMRTLTLPFDDLHKARLAAPAMLSGTLPFEGPFYFDLLPKEKKTGEYTFTAFVTPADGVEEILKKIPSRELITQVVPALLLAITLPSPYGSEDSPERIYTDKKITARFSLSKDSFHAKISPPLSGNEETEGEPDKPGLALSPSIFHMLPDDSPMKKRVDEELLRSFFSHPIVSRFNLLALETEKGKDVREQKWKSRAIILSLIILLLAGITYLEGVKLTSKKKAGFLKKEVQEIFTGAMGATPMVDPVTQMEERIQSLEKEIAVLPDGDATLSDILLSLSNTISADGDVVVTTLKYVRGKATIQGIASNQEKIDTLTAKLNEEGFHAALLDSGPAAEAGKIKFSVTMERK